MINSIITSFAITLVMQSPPDVPESVNQGGALRYAGPKVDLPLPHFIDASWKGGKPCELKYENDHIRSVQCAFPPGVGYEPHYYPPHWGYVVEGGAMRLNYGEGDIDRVVPKGFSWWSDGVEWHNAVNIGDTTVVYIIIEPKGMGISNASYQ